MLKLHLLLLLTLTLGLGSCTHTPFKKKQMKAEYIFRKSSEHFFAFPTPTPQERPHYPWEEKFVGGHPKITKEFFRCKGSALNPVVHQLREGKEDLKYFDCSGNHGLPLKDNKEFIYPTLIELLNYIQKKTEKRVVITCGHRCPQHNLYVDYTPYNWSSKHMLGAEVDFYVEGMEEEALKVIELVQAYYIENFTDVAYTKFERYEKEGLNVTTPPWLNKEIFIKLYLPNEGRNFDNPHTYPYIGIQMRFDRQANSKVSFEQSASQNYLRY